MPFKIDSDLNRFKTIIKNKVKNNLGKIVGSEDLISQKDGKTFKIPLKYIDIPRFTFGSNGGSGMGPGNEGDPMPGQNQPGSGSGGEKADHDFSAEFSEAELVQLVMEHLELPFLEPKSKGSVSSEKSKYNQISRVGNEGLRSFKRTYKEALKRQISTGTYNPDNPIVVPIKSDHRYKTYSTQDKPEINAAVFNIIDISGSMGETQRKMVQAMVFWTDLLLRATYKDIEHIFIVHDFEAQSVSKEDFFKINSAGGTRISAGLELCSKIIEQNFPFSEFNNYIYYYGDGDVYDNFDNNLCTELLIDKLIPNCNRFCYGQVAGGSGLFIDTVKSINDDKIVSAQINNIDDTLNTIKLFFDGGK